MATVILDELLELVIRQGASDLHLGEGRVPVVRVSGDLISLPKIPPFNHRDMMMALETIVGVDRKNHFESELELDFGYEYKKGYRFRGNAFLQQGKVGIALRLIPQHIRTLDELGLPPELANFARRKQGFFLVVGPTGHGKSTTLASLIDIVNRERTAHIVTIEDPIEYQFVPARSIIDQREVRTDTINFKRALTSVFREDIDVLMVGEMRDTETISTAVTAAETGHLVLSTLHTNTASQTVARIIDSFESSQQNQIRLQLAGSLAGIFSQRLLPRVSGGRIPAYELLINNNAVANLVRENRIHEIDTVMETGAEEGMTTINRTIVELVRRGEITLETAYAYSTNGKTLERMLN